jgi:molecular chaperone DnaK
VNVSARDKGTGKEQQIVIQSSGGLSKDQIENMVREAEANAEADKKRKESIEAINGAESVIHDTEKNLDDFKDDLEPEADSKVREKVKALREYLSKDQDQLDGEEIRKLSGEVQQESLKAFEVAYKKVRGAPSGAK